MFVGMSVFRKYEKKKDYNSDMSFIIRLWWWIFFPPSLFSISLSIMYSSSAIVFLPSHCIIIVGRCCDFSPVLSGAWQEA